MTAKSTDSEFSAVVVSPHVQFGFESLGPLPEPKNPPVIGEARSRWVLEDDSAIGLRPIPPALVDGMIGAQSLAVVTGEPKVGKSFLAVHLMMSVAVGSPFFGRRVTRGPVVYVAAEGIIHMPKRIDAWKLAHNATGRAGVHFLSGSVRLPKDRRAGGQKSSPRCGGRPSQNPPPRLRSRPPRAQGSAGADHQAVAARASKPERRAGRAWGDSRSSWPAARKA